MLSLTTREGMVLGAPSGDGRAGETIKAWRGYVTEENVVIMVHPEQGFTRLRGRKETLELAVFLAECASHMED